MCVRIVQAMWLGTVAIIVLRLNMDFFFFLGENSKPKEITAIRVVAAARACLPVSHSCSLVESGSAILLAGAERSCHTAWGDGSTSEVAAKKQHGGGWWGR